MEAEYIRHSCYCLPFQASSFFLLVLFIHLSGKLRDINYNNCFLEQFPTRLFVVLNLVHMPEHPLIPELLAKIGHEDRGQLYTARGGDGPYRVGHRGAGHRGGACHREGAAWAQRRCLPGYRCAALATEALATEALAAEALAAEELATEALATEA